VPRKKKEEQINSGGSDGNDGRVAESAREGVGDGPARPRAAARHAACVA